MNRLRKVNKDGLTPKQVKFCKEYVKDYNGTQSAIRAGYSKKTANPMAARMLAKVNIQSAINRLEGAFERRFLSHKEKILRELATIGYSDIKDYMYVDPVNGKVYIKDIDKIPAHLSKALKSLKSKSKVIKSLGESEVLSEEREIIIHDKLKALELMGKEIGMFKEKHEVTGKDGGPVKMKLEDLSDEFLIELLAAGTSGRSDKA